MTFANRENQSFINMDMNDMAKKTFVTDWHKEITFEEAFHDVRLRRRAMQVNNCSVPKEFTSYVFHKIGIRERGCRRFEKQLPADIRTYLKYFTRLQNSDVVIRTVHDAENTMKANAFLGVLVRYFFKKLIFNLRDEIGRFEYAENFAEIFPFKISASVSPYSGKMMELFDENFYARVQSFLDKHFNDVKAQHVCHLLLSNIHNFQITTFPEEAFVKRLNISSGFTHVEKEKIIDYLDSFPRLNVAGIEWFKYLYKLFEIVRKLYKNIDESISRYDDYYFQTLPEGNFADLYSLLDTLYFVKKPEEYAARFEKYLFFFTHSLMKNSTIVFFIDDALFECLKSLRRCKTSREDFSLIGDLAMLSLVHLRTKKQFENIAVTTDYQITSTVLENVKSYVINFPNICNAQVDVELKTDFLHGWMFLRTDDTCFEMFYSKKDRKKVDHFLDRILCSILCPDNQPVRHIVLYNAFTGRESRIVMPQNVQELRDFVRALNQYDFSQKVLNDEFLTRDLELYFENNTVA